MPFPWLAAAGLGMQGAGLAGQFYTMFQGSGADGRGRVNRALQQQMQTASEAQRYALAAGDVTSPLFRQTAAIEESRLRRAIAEGVASSQLMARKARSRGLTAGVRPEREDEAMNKAIATGYRQASEVSGELASKRLLSTAEQLRGVSQNYAQGAQAGSQNMLYSSVLNQMNSQRMNDMWSLLGTAGGGIGGVSSGSLKDTNLGGIIDWFQNRGSTAAPAANTWGQSPFSLGSINTTPSAMLPQFSWR